MRLSAAAVTFLLLTGTAHAAEWNSMWRQDKYFPADRKQGYCDPDRVEKQRKIDESYQKQIKAQPVPAAATNDPWGDLRASETARDKPKNGPRTR